MTIMNMIFMVICAAIIVALAIVGVVCFGSICVGEIKEAFHMQMGSHPFSRS